MTQAISLTSDGDRNPLNLVLGTHEIVDGYVDEIRGTKPWWRSMTPVERMEYLNQSAMTILDILGIPTPFYCGSTVETGEFVSRSWSIYLSKPLFSEYHWRDSGTPVYAWKAIADQAGHVFHEYEHLAAKFIAARYLSATKTDKDKIASALDMHDDIAANASSDPLPLSLIELGRACHYRVTIEKNPSAKTDYYQGLRENIDLLKVKSKAAEKRVDELEHGNVTKNEKAFLDALSDQYQINYQLEGAKREYELSENEIGSNVVRNLVKSRLLQRVAATR